MKYTHQIPTIFSDRFQVHYISYLKKMFSNKNYFVESPNRKALTVNFCHYNINATKWASIYLKKFFFSQICVNSDRNWVLKSKEFYHVHFQHNVIDEWKTSIISSKWRIFKFITDLVKINTKLSTSQQLMSPVIVSSEISHETIILELK